MTVAVVPLHAHRAAQMIRWGAQFARAHGGHLLVLYPTLTAASEQRDRVIDPRQAASYKQVQSSEVLQVVCECIVELGLIPRTEEDPPVTGNDRRDPGDATPVSVTLRTLADVDPANAAIRILQSNKCRLLLLPRHEKKRDHSPECVIEQKLFRGAPCETLELRPGASTGETCAKILVAVAGEAHDKVALQWAQKLAESHDGEVTALFVEPNVGRDAERVGRRIIQRIVNQTLGDDHPRVHEQIVLAEDIFQGLKGVDLNPYDLVLVGASHHGTIRRFLFGTVSDHLMEQATAAVAAVRERVPFSNRLRRSLERILQSHVPQLEREQRVNLVERVQSNSQWDFDFVALMGLATTIAAFGLIQNAGAVVIGAMLVAPLMTPLLGVGLSLVQGNVNLLRNAGRSVVSGFLLAFALGVGLGALSGIETPTSEMLARGSPNWMDLAIAFVSGAAAAYATSRPNLSSALPGVAIAAALVPPIATSGLGLYLRDERLCWGAILLFLTNILAIVIATALTLWGVGIRGSHDHGALQRWAKWGRIAFVIAIVVVTVVLTRPTQRRTHEVQASLVTYLTDNTECKFQHCFWVEEDGEDLVRIGVRASEPPSATVVNEIAARARRILGPQVKVRVETTLAVEVPVH